MRAALLRGREHTELGAVDVISERDAAAAISIGGAKKTYGHTDPNEDAAAFALGSAGTLLAVADGHRGFEAAELVLSHLLEHPGPNWTEPGGITEAGWTRHALAALCDANRELRRELDTQHAHSRTTLALAVALPELDLLLHATVGDSHLFQVRPNAVVDLAGPRSEPTFFLGHGDESLDSLARKCRIGTRRLGDTCAVVLATDGLSEEKIGVEDPAAAVAEAVAAGDEAAPALRPATVARAVCECALRAQADQRSGDNVAAAVSWLAVPEPG